MAITNNSSSSVIPTQCVCTEPGLCKLMGWNNEPRKMNEVKHAQCQDPAFFEVFYAEREKYHHQRKAIDEKNKNAAKNPAPARAKKKRQRAAPIGGVGTTFRELLGRLLNKRFLPRFGVKQIPNCTCKALEQQMNAKGPEWCLANVAHLSERVLKNTTASGITATLVKRAAVRLIKKAVEQHAVDKKKAAKIKRIPEFVPLTGKK